MQKLAEVSIRRPIFASMLILALVVVGARAWLNLGIDRFPPVDLPQVTVRVELPGAASEETETEIAHRIEDVVNTVEGIIELRSIATQGTAMVIATFDLERDIDVAAQDVRDRIAQIVNRLPRDARAPVISKVDADRSPMLTLAVTGPRDLRELSELADKKVKVRLEKAAGVGEVRLVGAATRAINIWVDADRLAAFQLPIQNVRAAVQRQNSDVPGGNVTTERQEMPLRTLGRLTTAAQFDALVIGSIQGAPVRIRDIGRAEDGMKEQRSFARLDGVPAVVLEFRRITGANTVAVIDAIKELLPRVQAEMPADVQLRVVRDQSRYIEAALHEIHWHLIAGSILASLVVLGFVRSWRATLIAAVAIPTSVISTFGVMWALDFTLNGITMLALVLMVGVVIDDAIVVLENIYRFVEEKGMDAFTAAREATREIGLAVLATTLSLVVIFLPVSFMSSVSGRFLFQFGITAAVAVLISLLVSFTLTPAMSARMLVKGDGGGFGAARSRRGFYGLVDRAYSACLRGALRWRLPVLVLTALTIASAIPLYGKVRQDYIPSDVDEAEFEVQVSGPEGASLAAMIPAMEAVEREVRQCRGAHTVLTNVGGSFFGGVNQGNVYLRIAPHSERRFSFARLWRCTLAGDPLGAFRSNYTQREVVQELRGRLRKLRPLRCSVRNMSSINIGGGNFEIDFALRGPDLEALAAYGEKLRQRANELGGIADADITLRLDKPELRAVIDRERAADLGVDPQDIASALRLMVGGDQEVSRFHDADTNEDYDVQLRLAERDRMRPGDIATLFVPRRDGTLVRLDNVVRLQTATTPSRIDRLDRERVVSLRASTAPGFALADRLAALRGAVREMNLPPAYTTSVSGRGRELEKTFWEFGWAFLLSVVFMYMILAAQFESLKHPLVILLSLPITVPFALLSLWLTNDTLNLYSALGILVLFGVVKKNAILQIDHMNQLRARGLELHDAILQANRDRLRPILMTTLAFVAGMLPLAIGAGPGAEERRTIAIVVIGGQSLALFLTLLATPVVYTLFAGKRQPT